VLVGALPVDEGSVELDGREVNFADPTASRAAGVRVVAQEPEIIPHVSVAENIFVGALPARGRLFRKAELVAKAAELILRNGFGQVLHPETLGSRLTPAQRQLVEILRALTDQPRVIAFDEPTSSLADHEVELLFTLIRRLREQGVAVVYVSHRLKEVFALGDRIGGAARRRARGHPTGPGHVRGRADPDDGRPRPVQPLPRRSTPTHPRRRGARGAGLGSADVHDINFQVRAGESWAWPG